MQTDNLITNWVILWSIRKMKNRNITLAIIYPISLLLYVSYYKVSLLTWKRYEHFGYNSGEMQ